MKVLRLLSYEPTRCWCTQARARKELLQPFFMEQHWFMMQRLVLYFLIVTDHACQVIFNFRSLWWIVFFKKINHDSIFLYTDCELDADHHAERLWVLRGGLWGCRMGRHPPNGRKRASTRWMNSQCFLFLLLYHVALFSIHQKMNSAVCHWYNM